MMKATGHSKTDIKISERIFGLRGRISSWFSQQDYHDHYMMPAISCKSVDTMDVLPLTRCRVVILTVAMLISAAYATGIPCLFQFSKEFQNKFMKYCIIRRN